MAYGDPTDDTANAGAEYESPDNESDDTPDDDYEGMFRKFKQWYRLDKKHLAEWRKDATIWYDYVAGKQWADEDEQVLKDQMRPVVTFNRIAPTIDSVTGIEIGNRRQVQFIPRQMGAAVPNEIITAAAEWVRDESDAETAESDMFNDTVISGYGWTDTRMDYETNADGMITIEQLDPFEMLYDYASRKNNLEDSRRMWRIRQMPCSEAEAMFPDVDETQLDATWARMEDPGDGDRQHNADPDVAYMQGDQMDNDYSDDDADKMITMVHVQWYEKEPYQRIAHTPELEAIGVTPPANGKTHEVDQADVAPLTERINTMAKMQGMPNPKITSVPMVRRVYKQAWIGKKIIPDSIQPNACPDDFTWQCVTGKRDKNKGTYYGLVRAMKDPQEWANKWLSQIMHIMNSNAKGGIIAEETAFTNWADAEKNWARTDKIIKVTDGAIAAQKFMPKPSTEFPAGFQALLQFAISSIPDVTGVSYEMLGTANRDQPGVLEDQRKQAGMTILAMLFDNLARYRKRQGKVMLYFITEYLSDERLIKIIGMTGPDGEKNPDAQYIPLTKQADFLEYDVVVDDSPTSPNQKEKIWQILQTLLPTIGSMLTPETWLALAKYSPLPSSVVKDLQDSHDKAQADQAQQAQTQQQMMLEDHQAKMGKTQSETEKNSATAQKTMVDAHVMAQTPPASSGQPSTAQGAAPDPAITGADIAASMSKAQTAQQQTRQASASADLAEVKTQNAQIDQVAKLRQLNDPFAGVKVK